MPEPFDYEKYEEDDYEMLQKRVDKHLAKITTYRKISLVLSVITLVTFLAVCLTLIIGQLVNPR